MPGCVNGWVTSATVGVEGHDHDVTMSPTLRIRPLGYEDVMMYFLACNSNF